MPHFLNLFDHFNLFSFFFLDHSIGLIFTHNTFWKILHCNLVPLVFSMIPVVLASTFKRAPMVALICSPPPQYWQECFFLREIACFLRIFIC